MTIQPDARIVLAEPALTEIEDSDSLFEAVESLLRECFPAKTAGYDENSPDDVRTAALPQSDFEGRFRRKIRDLHWVQLCHDQSATGVARFRPVFCWCCREPVHRRSS